MGVLGDVGAVQVIVILDRSAVLVVNVSEEREVLLEVNAVLEVVLAEDGGGHERHLIATTHCLLEFEDVEIEAVHAVEKVVVF